MTFNPSPIKAVALADFLTPRQLQDAITLWTGGGRAPELCAMIIEPNLTEIQAKLGTEMDAMYLAYAIEYTFGIGGTKE